jgi:protein O-GlcNAc transferase
MALKQQDDFEGAEAALRRATALDPGLPEAHFTLGVVLWQTGRADLAVTSFRAAITQKPEYAEAHYMLGTILRQQGNDAEALALFRRTIELQPQSSEAYLSIGQMLERQGDRAGATAALAEADRLNKRKADEQAAAYALNRGMAKLQKGDLPGAIAELKDAVRLAPQLARAHYQLGLALRKHGAVAEARAHFATAQQLAPYLEVPRAGK